MIPYIDDDACLVCDCEPVSTETCDMCRCGVFPHSGHLNAKHVRRMPTKCVFCEREGYYSDCDYEISPEQRASWAQIDVKGCHYRCEELTSETLSSIYLTPSKRPVGTHEREYDMRQGPMVPSLRPQREGTGTAEWHSTRVASAAALKEALAALSCTHPPEAADVSGGTSSKHTDARVAFAQLNRTLSLFMRGCSFAAASSPELMDLLRAVESAEKARAALDLAEQRRARAHSTSCSEHKMLLDYACDRIMALVPPRGEMDRFRGDFSDQDLLRVLLKKGWPDVVEYFKGRIRAIKEAMLRSTRKCAREGILIQELKEVFDRRISAIENKLHLYSEAVTRLT